MADFAASLLVSAVANSLSKALIEEYAALGGGAVRHVEWIERELRSMQGLLEQIEQRTYEEQEQEEALSEWAEKLKVMAREAEDVIETFLLKSVKRRRSALLYWMDKYKVGKDLANIRKRMSHLSQTRMDSSNTHVLGVSVETPGQSSSSSTTSSLTNKAMEKFDHILSQDLIRDDELIEMVEQVKHDLGHLKNILSNLNTTRVERQNVWLEEVKEVCKYTEDVAGIFIVDQRRRLFKKQMKLVSSQIGDVLHKCLIYEVGGDINEVTTQRSTTVPVPHLSVENLIVLQIPFIACYFGLIFINFMDLPTLTDFLFLQFLLLIIIDLVRYGAKRRLKLRKPKCIHTQKKGSRKGIKKLCKPMFTFRISIFLSIFVLSFFLPFEATWILNLCLSVSELIEWILDLQWSRDKNLKCTQRYLALMRVFLIDIEGVEGLNERQRVWVGQLRVMSQNGQSFIDAASYPKGKGDSLGRIEFAKDINSLLKEIIDITERKIIYDIQNITCSTQATLEVTAPLLLGSVTSIQESEVESEHDDNSATAMSAPAQGLANSSYRPLTGLKENIQTIIGEKELIDALLVDADGMGELDGRSRIWVEQMRGISLEAQSVINKYDTQLKHKPVIIYDFKYWTRCVVDNKIDGIKDKIEDASRRRKTYGLVNIQSAVVSSSSRARMQPSLVSKESSAIVNDLLSLQDLPLRHEAWTSVLGGQHLRQDQIQRWSQMLEIINTKLPSYLRRCLFYFVFFPAGYEIPVRRLVVLWVAEGLVHHSEEVPPELVAERYLTELIDWNMVQVAERKHNGKVKTCCLPSALRQLWLTKANESTFLRHRTVIDSNADKKNSIIRRVADCLDNKDIWNDHIHGDSTDSTTLRTYYKDVLSFLSFDSQEGSTPGQQVGNFIKGCISSDCLLLLRVLDLERVYKPKFPKCIAKLTRLRYLGLRWTYLESLPSSISKLLKLQTLDLKHTYIHTLPTSIWMMELRHLFLSETYRTKFPSQPKDHFSSIRFVLPQLRDNFLYDLQTLWGLFVDEETPVKGGLDKLVNITKLGLACQSMSLNEEAMIAQLKTVAEWIAKLEYLQSLRLKSRDEEGQPWILHLKSFENNVNLTDMYLLGSLSNSSVLPSQFPKSLVELTLSHSKLTEDPMKLLKDFPNLLTLCLLAESYVGKTMVCESKSFPRLRVLKLWALEQLEELEIETEALQCLKQLEIRSCPNLTTLPDELEHVNTLLELKLTNMSEEINAKNHKTPPNCRVVIIPTINPQWSK